MERYHYVPWPEELYALDKAARTAWNALCAFASWEEGFRNGRCFPSSEKLAAEAGVSENTIRKGLEALVTAGLLLRERALRGRRVVATHYTLLPKAEPESPDTSERGVPIPQKEAPAAPDTSKCGVPIPQKRGVDTSKSEALIPQKRQGNSTNITEPENRRGGLFPQQASAIFEALWSQFRRYNPDGKAEAREAFGAFFPAGLPIQTARAREEALVELLNGQAPAWEDNLSRGKAQYNPRMGRWLRRQALEAAAA